MTSISREERERLFWKWWNNERKPDEHEAAAFHAGYAATEAGDV